MSLSAMWTCDAEHCNKASDEELYVPATGEAEKREITGLLKKINIAALLARASHLRDGVPCYLPKKLQYDKSTRSSVMGDGIIWLARIRRVNATSPPPDPRKYIMRSEAATIQFLGQTKVPVPKIFDVNLDEGNPVGVDYILFEKMPGRSLDWYLPTLEQRQKLIAQLADIYIELQAHPFDLLGSLDQLQTAHVGPFAGEGYRLYTCDYLRTSIGSYAKRPIDAFLVHRFLLDSVPRLLSQHDPDGDHLLVDDDYNIMGIIDWEWAHTYPSFLAFNSPIMLLPVADFYNGVTELSDDEQYFAQGAFSISSTFCCGYDFGDWDGFLGLFQGLRRALDSDADLAWEDWREKMLSKYKDDDQLRELIANR
ncbi:hypothetical protein BDW74DRAFT_168089 [Aspergillus multicolor]|uniref:phosphotransferase family protein n=1 Tax=Aspergillus multicolor TaxID=41759 RepID=UPI003CCDEFE4